MTEKPKDIAKYLGISVEELIGGKKHITSSGLSELRKKNNAKYEVIMLGLVCDYLNLSIEELIKYSSLKTAIQKHKK